MRDDVNVLLLGSLQVTGSLGPVPVNGAGHRTLMARLAAIQAKQCRLTR
jgi:hypothetical protein